MRLKQTATGFNSIWPAVLVVGFLRCDSKSPSEPPVDNLPFNVETVDTLVTVQGVDIDLETELHLNRDITDENCISGVFALLTHNRLVIPQDLSLDTIYVLPSGIRWKTQSFTMRPPPFAPDFAPG